MSKAVAWVGADPGVSGALALLWFTQACESLEHPERKVDLSGVVAEDMPYHEVGGKKTVDFWRLAQILGAWDSLYSIQGATIERVHSMPKQGVVSSFSFGFSAGALQQAFASAGIRFTLIPPATWKAIYGLRGGRENKGLSRQKASQMFPGAAHLWTRVKDDGRAEAALLAHYGSKLRNSE